VLVGREDEVFAGGEVPVERRVGDTRSLGDRVQGGVRRLGECLLVGGDEDAYTRIEPVLRVLGPNRIGENGQGLVLKLAINISLAVQTLAFSEGLLLVEQEGLDRDVAAKVMAESQIGSPMLKLPLILDPPDEAWFDIGLMHKDIRLAREAGAEHGTPLPTASVADEILTKASSSATPTAT
jgi:3-hydroxyisobutyrate dehydrogenase-like beta-hydroxyacid dehydrogenase